MSCPFSMNDTQCLSVPSGVRTTGVSGLVADGQCEGLDGDGSSVGNGSDGAERDRRASHREVIRDGLQDAMAALASVDDALQQG